MKNCYVFWLFHLASRDYIASNLTLTFTTPERKCIRIQIVDDSEVEGYEYFQVYLTLPTDTGSEVLRGCGSIQINDNDGKKEETCINILHETLNQCFVWLHQLTVCKT